MRSSILHDGRRGEDIRDAERKRRAVFSLLSLWLVEVYKVNEQDDESDSLEQQDELGL
jgi:hypothetical protein